MLPDNSIPGNAAGDPPHLTSGRLPGRAVSPQVSLRRSRIGLWVPILGTLGILAVSAVLAATGLTPPGIGVIVFFWGMLQAVLLAGPSAMTTAGRSRQAELNLGQMLLTGRSWTGAAGSLRFRFVRGLVVCAAVIAYVAAVGELIVFVIPALAPGH